MEMEERQENKDMVAVEIKEHQKVLDSFDLSGLNTEERREIQQLITREADGFSVVASDIGNITWTQI